MPGWRRIAAGSLAKVSSPSGARPAPPGATQALRLAQPLRWGSSSSYSLWSGEGLYEEILNSLDVLINLSYAREVMMERWGRETAE